MEERRYVRIALTQHMVLQTLTKSTDLDCPLCITVTDDLPADARVVSVYYDSRHGQFEAVLEHESYDCVGEGAEIPMVELTLRDVSLYTLTSIEKRLKLDEDNSELVLYDLDGKTPLRFWPVTDKEGTPLADHSATPKVHGPPGGF